MKGKTHSTEEIIRILRQADGGETAQAICREHNISEQTFYRWKKKYGDMELADAKRLKALEKENAELKKMLAESMLENRVLKEVNSKKWCALRNRKRPSPMSLPSDCARCAGPVAIWAWHGRPIDIRRNPCRIVESNSTSGLWPCPGRIRAMAIGVSVARWPKKAGRSAASRCNVSVGVRASTCAQSPRRSRGAARRPACPPKRRIGITDGPGSVSLIGPTPVER